jgi:hypothetical protein
MLPTGDAGIWARISGFKLSKKSKSRHALAISSGDTSQLLPGPQLALVPMNLAFTPAHQLNSA